MFNEILMYVMAVGVVIGGTDRLLGNRFGLGDKFEEGFRLMGPIALSMVGIICLSPVLTKLGAMDKRGRVVNGALLVCGASAFSAHLGFTLGVAPEMVGPMLAAKLLGGAAAVAAALAVTAKGRKW